MPVVVDLVEDIASSEVADVDPMDAEEDWQEDGELLSNLPYNFGNSQTIWLRIKLNLNLNKNKQALIE